MEIHQTVSQSRRSNFGSHFDLWALLTLIVNKFLPKSYKFSFGPV